MAPPVGAGVSRFAGRATQAWAAAAPSRENGPADGANLDPLEPAQLPARPGSIGQRLILAGSVGLLTPHARLTPKRASVLLDE
jgi:hypothetical protein